MANEVCILGYVVLHPASWWLNVCRLIELAQWRALRDQNKKNLKAP